MELRLDPSDSTAQLLSGPLGELVRYFYTPTPGAKERDLVRRLYETARDIEDGTLREEFCDAIKNVPLNEYRSYHTVFLTVVNALHSKKNELHEFFSTLFLRMKEDQFEKAAKHYL